MLPLAPIENTPYIGGTANAIHWSNANGLQKTDVNLTWDATNGLYVNKPVGIGTNNPGEKLHVVAGNALLDDGYKMLFGTGKDSSIYYDGTDLYLNPKEVGTGAVFLDTARLLGSIGTSNLFLGAEAGNKTTSGTGGNTGVGKYALQDLTTGSYNAAFGASSLPNVTTGSYNVGIGTFAGNALTTAGDCFAMGYASLLTATGGQNIAIGSSSGRSITTGTGNIFIGHSTGNNPSQKIDAQSSMAIGYATYTSKSNQVVLGNSSTVETVLGRADNNKLLFGVDSDVSIYYDGTNLIINPKEVGSGAMKVAGNVIIGNGAAGVDYTLTFDGETNDGVVTWMEDEDCFQFAGDVAVDAAKAFYLGNPTTDGTWRMIRSGNNLLMERRESGAYVTKQTISA
jgi:hypothetical protein